MKSKVTPQLIYELFPTMFSSEEETETLELFIQKFLKSKQNVHRHNYETISEFVDITDSKELIQFKNKVETYLNQKNEQIKFMIINEFYNHIEHKKEN